MCRVTIAYCGSCQNTVHSVRYDEVCSPNCKQIAEVNKFIEEECFICQTAREQMAVDEMMRRLSISNKRPEKGPGGGKEAVGGLEFDNMMGGLRISDTAPQKAPGDTEKVVERMMEAMRISDTARRE